MANRYCTIARFNDFYDSRQMGMLSRDDNNRSPNTTRLQVLLDATASRLDSYLSGRYSLPLPYTIDDGTMPASLTLWVAAKTAERMYFRRSDMPAQVKDDVKDADDWLKDLIAGTASIVDNNGNQLGRAIIATLESSDTTDGRSRFDGLPGFSPRASPTSPSRGD